MRRRTLLRVGGLSLSTALAGCNEGQINDEKLTPPADETETPTTNEMAVIERTIRALWTAYNNENPEGVVETIHPDSPLNVTTDTIEFRGTVTFDSVTVTDWSDDTASAEATVTVTDGSRTITENHGYELRRHDGSWADWSYSTEEATPSATSSS